MKYMGSKARVAKHIIPIIKPQGRNYYEPFAGGMNMIDKVEGALSRNANDKNKYLIAMFEALLSGWVPKKNYTREEYSKAKNLEGENHLIGWIGFNCSYSGKWFGGYAGVVNTKGGVRDYQEEAFRNTMRQVDKLSGVQFSCVDYDNLEIIDGSVVYCDPPYEGTTGYKDNFNHSDFWRWVRVISKKNDVYVSEYNAPSDFEVIWQKPVKSSLSANGKIGASKNSVEKLFRLAK